MCSFDKFRHLKSFKTFQSYTRMKFTRFCQKEIKLKAECFSAIQQNSYVGRQAAEEGATNLNLLTSPCRRRAYRVYDPAKKNSKREYNSRMVMMMRNQEIDKRRKFSQPNSYQMMCCLDFYCFHFSSPLLFFSSFFLFALAHSFPISYSHRTA